MFKDSFYSIILRSFSLGGRFVLLLFLSRFLTPEELGIYGLFAISVSLLLYLVGLDFYTFNTREILAIAGIEKCTPFIRDQLILHFLLYVITLPIFGFLFTTNFLPWKHLIWLFPIMVTEHLSQEAYRIFITISRPIIANVILFLRNGVWAYSIVALMWFEDFARSLQAIWIAWFIGGALAFCATIFFLWPLDWSIAYQQKINWIWIRKGVGQSFIFLCATLSLRGIESADRFFIEFFHSTKLVGVYTFYAGIANVVPTFVTTGILMIYYPNVVKNYQQEDYVSYSKNFARMALLTIITTLCIAVIATGGIFFVLRFVNKPLYAKHLPVFFLLLCSASMFTISQLPHWGLYVRHLDKSLLFCSLGSLMIVLLLNGILVPSYHIYGAALSTFFAMIFLFLSKYFFLFTFNRHHPANHEKS